MGVRSRGPSVFGFGGAGFGGLERAGGAAGEHAVARGGAQGESADLGDAGGGGRAPVEFGRWAGFGLDALGVCEHCLLAVEVLERQAARQERGGQFGMVVELHAGKELHLDFVAEEVADARQGSDFVGGMDCAGAAGLLESSEVVRQVGIRSSHQNSF